MKRASCVVVLCLFACLFGTISIANAAGFSLYEWGNNALSRGTAFYATGDDASVVAYNPAQMTKLGDHEILAGVTAISPSSDVYIDGSESQTEKQIFAVPHAYYTHKATDDVWLGVGMFTRFGLGTKYDDNWAGRTLLREALLESFSFNPNVAFKFSDNLSVAVGVEVIQGSFMIKKQHPGTLGDLKMEVEGTSVAGNLGILYDVNDEWSVGFSYRSPVEFSGDGDASLTGAIPDSPNVTISATFPSSYTLGVGFKPTDKWTFESDVVFTRWELFDKMEFDFDGQRTVPAVVLPDSVETFNYKNSWRIQLGAEYQAVDWLALRGGFVYDQTPTRHEYASAMLPANDRMLFSLGAGFKGEQWFADLAGMYIVTKEREGMTMVAGATPYDVDFKNGRTWGLGATIGYEF